LCHRGANLPTTKQLKRKRNGIKERQT
jgi:hypothetical protein